MKALLFAALAVCLASKARCFYESSQYVKTLTPKDLKELFEEQNDELWLVQFYDPANKDMGNVSEVTETTAKSMEGHINFGAIDIGRYVLTKHAFKISEDPTHAYFTYYKHLPDVFSNMKDAEAFHEETAKQMTYFFEERSVHRYLDNRRNYELGSTDMELKVNKSAAPWLVVFYDPHNARCVQFAATWESLLSEFKERVYFGSLNNPVFKFMQGKNLSYPLVRYYGAGDKSKFHSEKYRGGLGLEELRGYLEKKLPLPEVRRVVDTGSVVSCLNQSYCIFAFVHLDVELVDLLKTHSLSYKLRKWGWFWSRMGEQPGLEEVFEVESDGGSVFVALDVMAATYMKIQYTKPVSSEDVVRALVKVADGEDFNFEVTTTKIPKIRFLRRMGDEL